MMQRGAGWLQWCAQFLAVRVTGVAGLASWGGVLQEHGTLLG